MQRRSDRLLERNLTGQELICRLQITHARGVQALHYARQRNEIYLTTLITGQRDTKILARQRNQRIAIEDRALVGELCAAEQRGNRCGGLNFYQRLVGSSGCETSLRAQHVLVLLEPEKDRQVKPDD